MKFQENFKSLLFKKYFFLGLENSELGQVNKADGLQLPFFRS